MSCLFISLAPAVNETSDSLRQKIVNYLKTDPELLDSVKASEITIWTENDRLENYTRRMGKTSEMGGAIEIRAFCEMYSANVIVNVISNGKKIEFNCTAQPAKITVHLRYTGNHYDLKYYYSFI